MARIKHWLMKTEPGTYSIDDLKRDGNTSWDGVRNFQARNLMRDEMSIGDLVLFYHSSADPPGVAGIAEVCSEAYPDGTAFNKRSKYYDPKSTKDKPKWFMVDIAFVEKFESIVPLPKMRGSKQLAGMPLLQRGQRLSVQPVSAAHFRIIKEWGKSSTAS